MKQIRPVRVIKRERAGGASGVVAVAEVGAQSGGPGANQPSERELRTVVAGWISEHRQRSEEYRRAITDLLKESGFPTPRAAKLA